MDYASTLCCALAFLLYYNTLDAGFVYDDRRAILSNPDLLSKTPWLRLVENDFWGTPLSDSGSHGSYRPLCVLTFRLNHIFSGFRPWGYHLMNVVLHCLATVLLIRCAKLVLPKSKASVGSTISGLIFASHPIHTEAVASVVGRSDLAACNFYFLSFLAYLAHVRYRDMSPCLKYLKMVEPKRYNRFVYALRKNITSCTDSWFDSVKDNERTGAAISFGWRKENICLCCWKNNAKMWIYCALCLLLALAAMLSKETGITVLGVCFVYDLVYSYPLNKKQIRSLLILASALSITLALRLPTRTPQFSTADNPTARDKDLSTRLLTFSFLPVFNFWLMVFPDSLSFDWGMDAIPKISRIRDGRNAATLAFYLGLVWIIKRCAKQLKPRRLNQFRDSEVLAYSNDNHNCAVCPWNVDLHSPTCRLSNNNNAAYPQSCVCSSSYTRPTCKKPNAKRGRTLSNSGIVLLSVAFLALPFLPATNVLFYVGFVVAERVLYLPSVGACLLVGVAGAAAWERWRRWRGVFVASLVLVVVAFGAKTVLRNRDWHDEEALYRAAVTINPPKAYGNLGSVLSSQGRLDEAESAFRKALYHRPNMADVHYNLGVLLQRNNQLNEAILSYQRAIHFRPSLALAYVNLGTALIAAGRCQEAISVLRQGSRLDGDGLKDRKEHESAKVSALLQLGALYSEQGRLQRALAAYREAAQSLPQHYPPQTVFNVLGETLARLQQDAEAERWYVAALNAQPDHVPAHITYGKLLAKNISRVAEAEQWFRKAQRLAPRDPSVYHHYGEFLASQRRFKEAANMYETAADLRPADHELAVAAATAMREAVRYQDAERWYRKAVTINPTDAGSHTNLGAILHLNGRYKEAAESYREALRLQPNDITTLTNLHKLHSMMT